jgi:hypothetical protein
MVAMWKQQWNDNWKDRALTYVGRG